MSHPCKGDPRPIYHADYTQTMQTDTLLKIKSDLMKSPESKKQWTWEAKRLSRINQVLSGRGLKTNMKTTEPEKKKPRAHNHVPASHREKPVLTQGISQDELSLAKAQAARFLSKKP